MKRYSITVCLFVFFVFQAGAQIIDSTIAVYADQYGQERTYLHYDKSTYAPGETIWFKAYLMSGIFAADASKTFYIDWTDDNGSLLLHSIDPIVDATSNGQFDIPPGYTGKFIHVKAYTKWMLNFDSSFLYNKDIRILSKTTSSPSAKNTILSTLQFFPEGGDAIAGIINKIAFKANDQWGRPLKIKGVIQDKEGVVIDSLHVIHDGMGYFFLLPQAVESL